MSLGYNGWLTYVASQPAAVNSYAVAAALYYGANVDGLVTMFTFGSGGRNAVVSLGAGAQFRFTPQPRVGAGGTNNHFATGGGPPPTLSLYRDVPASIASAGGVISAWGLATGVTGSPKLVNDSINGDSTDGAPLIRTAATDTLFTPGGAAAFVSSGPCSMYFVWRYRANQTGLNFPLADTTELGTKQGLQVQIGDNGNNIVYGRSISIREWNGASWSFDSTAIALSSGAFIPLKKQIIGIRLSNTKLDIQVDGQSVKANGITIARAYTALTTGKFTLGGSASDYLAVELYNSYLSDSDNAAATARLCARFGVKPSVLIQGDPTFASQTNSGAFPWPSKLPNGKIYVTIYNGIDGVNNTDHNDAWMSADGGLTWPEGPNVLTTSEGATKYSDLKTSEVLTDGSVMQTSMTYDLSLNFKNMIQRRAPNYNADGSPAWPAFTDILVGAPTWSATDCAWVESPSAPGTLFLAAFTLEGADTFSSAYIYKTTDHGVTVTRQLVASGQALSKQLTECFLYFVGTEIRYLIRDNTTPTSVMLQTHSTDGGVTWSAPVTVNLPGHSSAQQVKVLPSGREVGLFRRIGSSTKGAVFFRPAGSAWNAPWSNTVIEFDPLFGGFYYGGIIPGPSPTHMMLVAARTGGPGLNSAAYQFEEWMLDFAMPGTVTPSVLAIASLATQQLTITGAGDYTFTIAPNNSGGSVSPSGLYTAGPASGVDTITVVDLNGHTVGTCVATVTGGTAVLPTSLGAALYLWLRGDLGVHLTGTNITQIDDQGPHGNNFHPLVAQPTTSTVAGRGAMHFVANDALTPIAAFTAGMTGCEVFVVAKNKDDGITRMAAFAFTGSASSQLFPFEVDHHLYDVTGSTTRQDTGFIPPAGALASPFIYGAVGVAGKFTAFFNGTQIFTVGVNVFGNTTITIGACNGLGYQGDIAEIIIVNRECTAPERANMITYLKTWYAIP